MKSAVWAFLALAVAAVTIVHSYLSESLRLQEGKILLDNGKSESALEKFRSIENSLWFGRQALAGGQIALILSGSTEDSTDRTVWKGIGQNEFALLHLMMNQLKTGHYAICLRLVEIAESMGYRTASLYKAAALVELSMFDDARSSIRELDADLRNTGLGKRVQSVLRLASPHTRSIIRDRRGELIGVVEEDDTVRLAREDYASYLQPVVLRQVEREDLGNGLRLSIDLELSKLAAAALGERQGSIVLMDVQSGDLLAAVSDEKSAAELGESASPAFEQQIEPASIMKLITTTAAYRAGIDADAEIATMRCDGAERYGGELLYCVTALGRLRGLNHAMRASCNIAFANLGVRLGWKPLVSELRRFGFDSSSGNPFPLGRILHTSGTDRSLADLAIGLQNTELTPVHGALIAQVFANRGMMMKPRLIVAEDGFLGYSVQPLPRRKGRKILEEGWLEPLFSSMLAVTGFGGTASWIAPFDFPVAMKTGTGASYRYRYHINYIGYGPAFKPAFAFSVRITNNRTSMIARRQGYDVTSDLLRRMRGVARSRGWKVGWDIAGQ